MKRTNQARYNTNFECTHHLSPGQFCIEDAVSAVREKKGIKHL